jgi:hypothetical protein
VSRLAVLIVALAAFTACRRGPSAIDPALEAFVPPDTVLLAGVRVEQLRGTPLFEKVMAATESLEARTGFDPRKDARELLLASDGRGALLAARGSFRAGAVPDSAPPTDYRGTTIYGAGQGAFAFIDASTAVAGTPESVRAALDRRGSKPPASALLSRARAIPAEYQVWAVSSGTPDLPGGAGNFDRMLRAVADVTFVADLRSGVRAEARGICRDEPNARALADALRGLLALGRLAAPKNDPAFSRLYDTIRIEQQRDTVRVNADVPAETASRVLDLLRPVRPSGM